MKTFIQSPIEFHRKYLRTYSFQIYVADTRSSLQYAYETNIYHRTKLTK